ncbi:MAG: PRC-barrel domain-containing protein [Blastocatellia bacterium]|nr:PRC-barrel domain-containing protein [Blastocatellia bacterium]
MLTEQCIPIVRQLKGAPVVSSAGRPLGPVADVLIHPTAGRWLGVLLTTLDGLERIAPADYCAYARHDGIVTTSEYALKSPLEFARAQPQSAPVCRQMIGTQIVTEQGELRGYVSEVLLRLDTQTTLYHVAVADWRRFFKLGFYLIGDAPHYYSSQGARLLVAETTLKAQSEFHSGLSITH